MKVHLYWMAFITMGVLLISFAILLNTTPNIVVVDMTRAIQEPSARLAHSRLSEVEQGKIIKRFTTLLPEVIDAYAASHHCTVIGAHVFASKNQFDITPLMIEQTIQRIKHER